jgi:tetratricopeptide (TPR) repeat protein
MKNFFVLLFLFFNIYSQESFLVGNKLFQENEYAQAVQEYQKINNKGFGAWFNLGVSYFKIGNYLESLIAFKKAEKCACYNDFNVLNANLELVHNKLNIPFKFGILRKLLSLFSLFFLQLICLFLIYLIFISFYFYKKNVFKNIFKYLGFALSVCLVFLGVVYFLKINLGSKKTCIIKALEGDADLYVGPGNEFHKIDSIGSGYECVIKKELSDFNLISCSGKNGWVKKDDCVEI